MLLHITLKALLTGDGANLEQRLHFVPVPDGVVLLWETEHDDEEKVRETDILIYGGIPKPEREYGTDALERVLCAPSGQVPSVLSETTWTDYWPQPMTDAELSFRFRRLLESVCQRKEAEMTRIYLSTLIDSMPDLVWFKNLEGVHLMVNDAFCRTVGKPKDQCVGKMHNDIWGVDPNDPSSGDYACRETEAEVIRRKKLCLFDEKVKSKSGLRQFKTYKSPLFDGNGSIVGTAGIGKDVTDLQNTGRELEVILSGIPFATLVADDHGNVVSVNPKFCEYFGVTADFMLNINYQDISGRLFEAAKEKTPNSATAEFGYRLNGEMRYYRAQQQLIHDIFGNHFGAFFLCFDVTTEHELQSRLQQSANTDFLTSLYNRRYFYEMMNGQKGQEVAGVVYFDLDDFKKVNDTYGHQAGDTALILMADLLKKAFVNELITRLGGDEFVVAFCGQCEREEVLSRIERFIRWAGDVFHATEHLEGLSVSAGLACGHGGKSVDIETLIFKADKALYAAKQRGKAQYVIYEE